ncbi:MAG TPA: hypothetical protein VMF08_07650 [Candidatus Sulfotelmatobacter sp.]|nr:hypothetical protein [Candidatus Sulfotelmatobacter sp.]
MKQSYDPSLPIVFDCPQCKKRGKLRGGEAEHQTPKDFLPRILSFHCPTCQARIKVEVDNGRWLEDVAGQKVEFVLANAQLA